MLNIFNIYTVVNSRIDAGAQLISPELVADGMVQLIEDESKNAQVLRVNHSHGLHYKIYGKL